MVRIKGIGTVKAILLVHEHEKPELRPDYIWAGPEFLPGDRRVWIAEVQLTHLNFRCTRNGHTHLFEKFSCWVGAKGEQPDDLTIEMREGGLHDEWFHANESALVLPEEIREGLKRLASEEGFITQYAWNTESRVAYIGFSAYWPELPKTARDAEEMLSRHLAR